MGLQQLIGAEVSLYTGKVRAYLRYKGIAFEELPASGEVFQKVIIPRTGVRYIPILISDDDQAIQDSTAIIDFLEQRFPDPSIYPADSVQRLVALLFEVYGDEWLVIPAMHYRWNVAENRTFAIGEFGRLSRPNATPEEQRALGEKLATPFAGALRPLGVDEATAPAVERSYHALLQELARHFETHPFLLGSRPSIGDFALNGPLYAHLYRDPASGRLMQEAAPQVARWVERMNTPEVRAGVFLPDGSVPETLEPPLARMFREQGPVLLATMERFESWAGERDNPLPRTLGRHAYTLEGAVGERHVYAFNLWRWQRVHDHYRALDTDAKRRADALLERVGGRALVQRTMQRRLARRQNQLFALDV
jgi:glutathione S-transferase